MKKLLLGVGALLLASTAAPAAANDWDGYSGYRNGSGGGYGYNYIDVVRRHVRACRQHARFHARLGEEHRELHDEGIDYGWEHSDAHGTLGEAHEAYHDSHSGLRNCSYWNRQYYNMLQGTRYRGYGRSYGYDGY